MMKHPARFACGALVILAMGLGSAQGATQAAQTKRPRGSSSVKVVPSGSQESTAERERRLKRECRGRPNAGACLGFAS
ncbi:hypothetical protein [Hydrogenophaga sp. OTU3427]|uniref:hypothetical protein n=1 Tax=Hydrogenophaga sp. OTU3427 TaxID=3043856 RepID=UPI00313D8F93